MKPEIKIRKHSRKGDAERWDKMHCGKGMTSAAISKKEKVSLELVRKTLRAYRQEMFG